MDGREEKMKDGREEKMKDGREEEGWIREKRKER